MTAEGTILILCLLCLAILGAWVIEILQLEQQEKISAGWKKLVDESIALNDQLMKDIQRAHQTSSGAIKQRLSQSSEDFMIGATPLTIMWQAAIYNATDSDEVQPRVTVIGLRRADVQHVIDRYCAGRTDLRSVVIAPTNPKPE